MNTKRSRQVIINFEYSYNSIYYLTLNNIFKYSEVKSLAPHPTMSKPIKLIDESNEFRTSALEYLQDSNSNFLVVGVIGYILSIYSPRLIICLSSQ